MAKVDKIQEALFILGLAWWFLDYPFMKRHSRDALQKHPELRGEDLAQAQQVSRVVCGVGQHAGREGASRPVGPLELLVE